MQATQRKRYIMKVLQEELSVDVINLANKLETSKVTIRKDLDELAEEGLVTRTHGGAILTEKQNLVRLISNTINERAEEKKAICKAAFELVKADGSIIIDSGSTTVHLSQLVTNIPLTVITNSLLVMQELAGAHSIDMLLVGGQLRRDSLAAIGSQANQFLSNINADILFLGARGFSLEAGITCTSLAEADTKQAMIKSAARVCLLADSSKLGTVSLAKICDWKDIDVFVTDGGISPSIVRELEERDIKVIIAQL